ncbi:tRNA(Ser) Um(44) 2'-O-methyltransferase [Kickxella alabastrina]|uniref:tRNA(Ser) Um(44) 2'-O-methyltransferase n=1 Tax=Kickxella alabastrina TaxID=61397 RepID=A0ACC1IE37_9FUNG|nr:tRNA(Ser) Um(44) 2'-O-methyltransferase [Kickxella alabastrina]
MSTQVIIDRIAQKKQELAALEQVQALSENTASHCLELNRQMGKVVEQYKSILGIAKGWSGAFENAALVDIPQTNSNEDDSDQPESVIRIPAAAENLTLISMEPAEQAFLGPQQQQQQQILGAESTDTLIEAQRIAAFAKFKPEYFWEETKEMQIQDESDTWRLLASASIEDAEECHFLGVMDKWIQAAELIIPPVKSTEILEDCVTEDGATAGELRRVRRVLVPKRKLKDPLLEEDVVVSRLDSGIYAQFIPRVSDPSGIPFYYPSVHEFAFGYVEMGDSTQHDSSSCKLVIIVRELSPGSTVATKKHRMVWQDLIKRLYKWTATERFGYQKRVEHDIVVSYDLYTAKYQELKAKYALYWVENWPEQTDPRKFVYEDIAIASWIICLWQGSNSAKAKRPRFVDLGCGNGLLVHLLNSEGFSGYGIDQCSRKVWAHFGGKTDLRAQTLVPYEFSAEDADWIIGNHADELVPWIPIIAARTTGASKPGFIIIPCCPHDLSGKKMVFPVSAGQSKYHLYVKYIVDLAEKCGFSVEKEFLRIPSTKNVAIVGRRSDCHAYGAANANELARMGEQDFVARVPDSMKNEIRLAKMRERDHYATNN